MIYVVEGVSKQKLNKKMMRLLAAQKRNSYKSMRLVVQEKMVVLSLWRK
jgi:hypothetical protein